MRKIQHQGWYFLCQLDPGSSVPYNLEYARDRHVITDRNRFSGAVTEKPVKEGPILSRALFYRVLAAAILLSPAVPATTVLKISVEQMTLASHTIAHGVVVSSRAETIDGNPRHIRTIVVVDVKRLLRGQAGTRQLRLELPGGQVGPWAMKIPGMPSFTAGEEVVLFLEKTQKNWALTGLSQGKFSVATDPKGKKTVERSLDGIHMMTRNAKGRLQEAHTKTKAQKQTLAGLLAEVTHYLQKSTKATK